MVKTINSEDIHDDKAAEDDRLLAWLNILWLRPATALLKANELKHLSRFLPFKEPAADLGCGDGSNQLATRVRVAVLAVGCGLVDNLLRRPLFVISHR